MRPLSRLRLVVLPAAALAAAACSGYDDFLRQPNLTPAEVAGTYRLCALRFTPREFGLPPVDVLATLIESSPAAPLPAPSVTFDDATPAFAMVYVRERDGAVQEMSGEMEFAPTSVFLYPRSLGSLQVRFETLLPEDHIDLVYDGARRELTAGEEVSGYRVRREDYGPLAGIPLVDLPQRIFGHVTARFAEDGC